jgi:hypothetical protein
MSDHWIALIPEDPSFVPETAAQEKARDRFAEISPDSWEINIKLSNTVQFFDCGENFERVLCPSCNSEVAIEWWQERMDEDGDDDNGFKLNKYATPCCKAQHTLHDLIYDWPQGFSRFALDAMNPDIGKLDDGFKKEFESILGTPLRVIYQHI